MDDERPVKEYPLSASKMSKTPSWILLGFVLGGLFVFTFHPGRQRSTPPPAPGPVDSAKPAAPRDPPPLSLIETIFEKEGHGAVWSGDTTEVALWTPTLPDYYEVRKIDGKLYFRSIPALTRRIITRGKPPAADQLLQFTESEEQYREWQEYGRRERPFEKMWEKPNRPPANTLPAPTLPSVTTPKLEITPPPINPTLPPPPQAKKPEARPAP